MAQTSIPFSTIRGVKTLAPGFMKYDDPNQFSWEPNKMFNATITILDHTGKVFSCEDDATKIRYWILPSHMMELIRRDVIRQSKISGTWEIYKHGSSYGIRLV